VTLEKVTGFLPLLHPACPLLDYSMELRNPPPTPLLRPLVTGSMLNCRKKGTENIAVGLHAVELIVCGGRHRHCALLCKLGSSGVPVIHLYAV